MAEAWPKALALLISGLALPGLAAEPRSAIPWLSESVRKAGTQGLVPAPAALDPSISALPLSRLNRDGTGLIGPAVSGFPADLWGSSDRRLIARKILDFPAGGLPAVQGLFHQILIAETAAGPGPESGLFLARIDRLLAMGALDDAEALLARAGAPDAESFRRMVDIGLLTGRTAPSCDRFAENPALAPTLPIRVFCLARSGDWDAAALTLSVGIEIGDVGAEQGELLTMFLDPHLFEDSHEPLVPAELSAFDFVIREALALPRPEGTLPLAFLHADLVRDAPMRHRIEASERLIRTTAITPTQLFAAWRAGRPAASGGIWDRAAAVQALDAAITLGGRADIIASFKTLMAHCSEPSLAAAVAREYWPALIALEPGPDAQEIFDALLLAGQSDAAALWLPPGDAVAALALGLAGQDVSVDFRDNPKAAALLAGFSDRADLSSRGQELGQLLDSGQRGEALLGALALLTDTGLDPREIPGAINVLRRAGFEKSARAIAVETLLFEGRLP
jgi:hypothetical protein